MRAIVAKLAAFELPKRGRLYVAGIILLGLTALVHSLFRAFVGSDFTWLALAIATAVGSLFPVRLPVPKSGGQSLRVTPSDVFIFAGLLFYSPEIAVVLAAVDCIFGSVKVGVAYRVLFNLGLASGVTLLVGKAFYLWQDATAVSGIGPAQDVWFFYFRLLICTLAYFLLSTSLLALAVAKERGRPWIATWQQNMFWSSIVNATGVTAIAAVFISFPEKAMVAVGLAAPLVLVMYYSHHLNRQRLDALSDSHRFLQSTLDSMSSAVAILDKAGAVVATNASWRLEKPTPNPLMGLHVDVGTDYFKACQPLEGVWERPGFELSRAIKEVLSGSGAAIMEYTTPDKSHKTYAVSVSRFEHGGDPHLVVSHEDITQLKSAERRIWELAYYDKLTGLPNREFLKDHLAYVLENCRDKGSYCSLVSMDLDEFERINNTLGAPKGDEVLKRVADRLRLCLRSTDQFQGDFRPAPGFSAVNVIARPGADEFALLLVGDTGEDARKVAQRVIKELSKPFRVDESDVFVTTSIGISCSAGLVIDAESLIKQADIALHNARKLGRNSVCIYSEAMQTLSAERLSLESNLHRAMERDEFLVLYQPKIDLKTMRWTGVEALVRWQHPVEGVISPGAFIPIVEEMGLISRLGERILRRACQQAVAWQRSGLPHFRVAVNLSPLQFKNAEVASSVARVLQETGLDPRLLELELTEGIFLEDAETSGPILTQLRDLGVRIALDDFGTGYSSLSYLKRFPVDLIKIDRTFVEGLPTQSGDAALVKAIVSMADNLNLSVVAEGVETDKQLNAVKKLGCHEAQGYLISRPVHALGINRMIRSRMSRRLKQLAS